MRSVGLRARFTLLFACGALVLSTAVSIAAYDVTRRNLVAERERTAVRAAYFDAAVVQQGLSGDDADVVAALRNLDTGQFRRPLVRRNGQWFARNADDGLTQAVPREFLTTIERGQAAVQRVQVAGNSVLVVGVPLPRRNAQFVEVTSLTEAEATLRTVAIALAVAAIVATAAAAALGLWAVRRLLRPLRLATQAAERITSGDLSARIDTLTDPDLAPLSSSFNAMVSEVSDRIQRDRRFAADVSHELRSPLQTLTAAASVLTSRRSQLDERTGAAVDLVADEAERFTSLVQDLLELARDDTSAKSVEVAVLPFLQSLCTRKGVPLAVLDVDPTVTAWPMEARRIDRILDNLVDNANKHGGGVCSISAVTEPGLLRLAVDDAGPGVPIEEREIVFDRFGRGRAAHARGDSHGTGLGLSIAARHAAAHGGRITIGERPGGGCRFTLVLPLDGVASDYATGIA